VEKWGYAFVRTTIELPDPLFRDVKATAARQGMRLKDYSKGHIFKGID